MGTTCISCGKNDEESIFQTDPIGSYSVWAIRREKADGQACAVDLSAALCDPRLKAARKRHALRSLPYWLAFAVILFAVTGAVFMLLSGGEVTLAMMLTFPNLIFLLVPLLMTPFMVLIRYHHSTIPRYTIASLRIGKDRKKWEELGFSPMVYDAKPTSIIHEIGFGGQTKIRFDEDRD